MYKKLPNFFIYHTSFMKKQYKNILFIKYMISNIDYLFDLYLKKIAAQKVIQFFKI
jgi:hypothetical protein